MIGFRAEAFRSVIIWTPIDTTDNLIYALHSLQILSVSRRGLIWSAPTFWVSDFLFYWIMTSAPTILATCKQTRFHLLDENPSPEVSTISPKRATFSNIWQKIDVEGLSITVTSSAQDSVEDVPKTKSKGKSKAKAAGKELISDGHLRLKGAFTMGW